MSAKQIISCILLGGIVFSQQDSFDYHRLGISAGAQYTKKRDSKDSDWGPGLTAALRLSPRYGITFSAANATLKNDQYLSETKTFAKGMFDIHFPTVDVIKPFTSIGVTVESNSEDPLFIFVAGMVIPVTKRFFLRGTLEDYNTDIGIPFVSYPFGRTAISGAGVSKYISIGFSLGFSFFDEKGKHPRPFGKKWFHYAP